MKLLDVDLNEKRPFSLCDSTFRILEIVQKRKDMISRFSSSVNSVLKYQAV